MTHVALSYLFPLSLPSLPYPSSSRLPRHPQVIQGYGQVARRTVRAGATQPG